MDDFLSLLLVAVIYLIAAFSKAGKKKGKAGRQRRAPMRSRTQSEQREARAAARDRQTQTGFGDAFETRPDAAETREHACEDIRQMHLHEVTQRQFADSVEGEDPCHAGGAETVQEDDASYKVLDAECQGALAQDVLRGVIMSEILARPHERALIRRGRR